MNEIARDTFDYEKFAVVSQLMWESMDNQRPAAWRVVFKGLTLLEHLIKNGSERCVDDARNHGHVLRSLFQFNYYEGTVDRGSGVREKAKQLVEILSDDERIREERQKARKLREKFGGNLGGVSGGAGGGGGGRYAGYGNDDWSSGGGGGGYGDGGIGSERYRSGGGGGRYDSEPRGGSSNGGGYTGRYDDDRESSRPSPAAASPTFAALPDEPKKSKTKKKKKKDDDFSEPAPAPALDVDLFGGFDSTPVPTAAPAVAEPASEEFDAFQSAGAASAAQAVDPFAAAPAPAVSSSKFGGFDAFGGSPSPVGAAPMMQHQQQFDAFAGPNVGGGSAVIGSVGDDDFGDFTSSTAATAPVATSSSRLAAPSMSSASSDPLSKLISLDGLEKNTYKQQSSTQMLNAPTVANQAAATYVQEQGFIQQSMEQGRKGNPATSFAGLDGLGSSGISGMGGMSMMMSSMSLGTNPNVMGVGTAGGKDAISSLMDPQALMPPKPQQQQQAPQMGAAGAGMMGVGGMSNPQVMQQMMQSMTPQQKQQMMMMIQMQQQQQQGMQPGFGGHPQGFGSGFGSTSNQMGGFR
jgi:epsin